jgi:hypothetical protein
MAPKIPVFELRTGQYFESKRSKLFRYSYKLHEVAIISDVLSKSAFGNTGANVLHIS